MNTGHVLRFRKSIRCGLAAALLSAPMLSWGKTFTVTRTDDFNFPGTEYCLRTAVLAANEHPGKDTIVLGAGIYTLDIQGTGEDQGLTGDLDITEDLIIIGAGQDVSIIDGHGIDRVLQVHAGASSCSISDVTITNGREADDNSLSGGGGIWSHFNSKLTLNRVTVTRNLIVGDSNNAAGGGILCLGECNLYDTTVSDNYAKRGGGIFSSTNLLMVYRSTLAHNVAYGDGGGALVYGASVFENCTFFGNMASAGGGAALGLHGGGEIRFCTITGNNAVSGGAIFVATPAKVTIHDSIVADNTLNYSASQANCACSYPACLTPFYSASNNIDGGTSCEFTSDENFNETDPLLDDLADNGGHTRTCMPKSASPAIDHARVTSLPVDQRSYPRTVGSKPDIGSVETSYATQPSATPLLHPMKKPYYRNLFRLGTAGTP